MLKITRYLIGPELLWLVFYILLIIIVKSTHSPTKSMDKFYELMAYRVPFILVPLTFALFYLSFVGKDFLIIRIWIASIIGGHFVIEKSMSTYTEQGPGIGTAYIMGMIFIFAMLILLTVGRIIVKMF